MAAMNRNMWTTDDGHLYRSIPTDIPQRWERRIDDEDDTITYASGEYEIERVDTRRHPDGFGGCLYFTLTRQTVALHFPFSRLKDAKAHAVKNARGEDVVNVA